MNEVNRLALNLDDSFASLLVNIETLEQVRFEMARLRQQYDFCEIDRKSCLSNCSIIRILDDLLYYTIVDLADNYELASSTVAKLLEKTSGLDKNEG
ncbi:MAG TPA: hypothetical protein VFF20_05280 [Pseudogracilibacillus sp.]|nr:hypothetical protein [Pseudogracilibacillus sp.]